MSDRLTQLQDCLDQLAIQMFAALTYTNNDAHHARSPIPNQPVRTLGDRDTSQTDEDAAALNNSKEAAAVRSREDAALQMAREKAAWDRVSEAGHSQTDEFLRDVREMARDLVVKEQQIEVLIGSLPGLGMSERAQGERMVELERELGEIEGVRGRAVREKERLVGVLGEVVGRVRGL